MAQDSWPFAGRDTEEADWRKMAPLWRATGVVDGEGDELDVEERAAGAALQVDVQTGSAWIIGHYYENDAVVEVPVPAPAVNPRIDTIVVEFNFAVNPVTRQILRVAGVEAAVPAAPALTQNRTTKFQFPLRDVYCRVGMVSVKTADDAVNGYLSTDRRVLSYPHTPPFRGCRAKRTANQVITTGTETAISFTSDVSDPLGLHDPAANAHRFGPAAGSGLAGWYEAKCRLTPQASATGTHRTLYLKKGGTTYLDRSIVPSNAVAANLRVETEVHLAEGEWIGAYFLHDRGSDLDAVASDDGLFFELRYLGA